MNDSKFVVAVIAVLELGHMAFVILDAIAVQGKRRIAGTSAFRSHEKPTDRISLGSCLSENDLRYTRTSIACQIAECCFMMLCCTFCDSNRSKPTLLRIAFSCVHMHQVSENTWRAGQNFPPDVHGGGATRPF